MVKQFQKPKGSGGRQRKFVFCGKNYCFVSWFRENKPFRARIHFGSTYSIGTYSCLGSCLKAIAEFTDEKVRTTTGFEQRGWRQRDEKAFAQWNSYVKNERETEAIAKHFDEKRAQKEMAEGTTTKTRLSVSLRSKLMEKRSPSIPPRSMMLDQLDIKLEQDPIKLESTVQPIILGEIIEEKPQYMEEDHDFLFDSHLVKKSEDVFYNPHHLIATSPVISPCLSMDILPPPVISPVLGESFQWNNVNYGANRSFNKKQPFGPLGESFRWNNVNDSVFRSYHPKKKAPKQRFKLKLRDPSLQRWQ